MNRWIREMREYNYDIQYLKGKYEYVADKLSRPVSHPVHPYQLILFWPNSISNKRCSKRRDKMESVRLPIHIFIYISILVIHMYNHVPILVIHTSKHILLIFPSSIHYTFRLSTFLLVFTMFCTYVVQIQC